MRDRQAGGYDFCKPAGVISSQGAKPRGMKLLPRVSKNHMPPSLAITQQYCYMRLLNKKSTKSHSYVGEVASITPTFHSWDFE